MLAPNRPIKLRFAQSHVASCFKNAGSLRAVALFILIGFLATTFYSSSSASSVSRFSSFDGVRIGIGGATFQSEFADEFGISLIGGSYAVRGLMALEALQSGAESIVVSPPATRAPGCTDPNVMCLGETVTATVTNAPLRAGFRERRIQWVAPNGTVPQVVDVTQDPQTDNYTLQTTGSFAQVGKWAVRTINNRGGGVVVATFEVIDPTQPSVDLELSMTGPANVTANTNASYIVTVTNHGPDTAANVTLVNPVPYNTTFVSASAPAGFSCTTPNAGSVGDIVCSSASLALNASAAFTFTFNVNSDVTNGAAVYNTAKTGSSTNEPNTSNNYASVYSTSAPASGGGGGGTCTLSCPANITTPADTTDNGQPGAIVHFDSPSAQGSSCGTIAVNHCNDCFFPVGTTVVSATEDGTTGASCSFTVTVTEGAAPTITCPPDKTATADSNCQATVDPGSPTTTGDNVTVTSSRSDGLPFSDPYPAGTTTITWTATNSSGTASCQQAVTVNDTTAPTITCPANITTGNDAGQCSATVDPGTATATDNCDSSPTVTGTRSDGQALNAPYPKGTTTITWTASDGTNSTSCTQTVTVNDTENPTITCPANITQANDPGSCSASINPGTATATDNCGNPTVNGTRSDGQALNAPYPVGTTTITWTATDGSNNSSSCTQTITVNDTENPTITAPPNVTAYTGPGATSCDTVVSNATLGTASANDNCPGVTVSRSPSGNTFPVGTTTVTWTATDAHGNTATATQTVTVNDTTAPTVTAPADSSASADANCQAPVPNYVAGSTASDNCGNPTVTQSPAAGTLVGIGPHTVTVTATDGAGNHSSDAVVFTVIDNTPPVISCPANIVVHLPLNSTATSMAVSYPAATATDNCSVPTVTSLPASGSVFSVGTTTVNATATDAAGNSSSCSFTVTVLYNFTGFFPPVANLPTLNVVNAGRAIPVKFSLSGYKGLNIFAADSPYTVGINCDGSAPQSDLTDTVTAGGSSLSYSSGSDQYIYVWKTESSWAGTCRQLVVKLNDGSELRANFKFK